MSGKAQSYQKYDGSTGTYQALNATNGSNISDVPRRSRDKWIIGAAVVVVIGVIYAVTIPRVRNSRQVIKDSLTTHMKVGFQDNGKLKLFDDTNRFVMEDYDARSTFASFLPGVAGYFGKPVWAFYVNRGQAISTFGTESKDYPILEFESANKAYQSTPYVAFRTFMRASRGEKSFQIEPFSLQGTRNLNDSKDNLNKPKRILFVGTNEVELQEVDGVHGIATNVQYFILPDEDFAALIRRTTISNEGTDDLTIEVLDGLAKMEPFGGILDWGFKQMGRTLEGWMGVYHADDSLTMPFYKLSTEPSDTASVKIEEAGHYCLAFVETTETAAELLPIVFDTSKVFGQDTAFLNPSGLDASSVASIIENPQYGWAKTSSAFAALKQVTLKPGENITIASVYGKADHIEILPQIRSMVTAPNFIQEKHERARVLINDLTAGVETKTANPLFDGTVKQMFLDNSLRGGVPTILGNVDSDSNYDEDRSVKVFHSFSRIHGDLERDYNAFKIDPTYFSQGPGNFRDIAQNRRNDVTFFPRMASFNIQMFLSFIQADGYEPLTVEAVVYRFENPQDAVDVAQKVTADAKSAEVLGRVLNGGPFRPGQVFSLCDQLNIHRDPSYSNMEFINAILEKAEDRAMAVYGSGYWGDHWDYYIDLIESYLAIYPDGEEQLMYDKPLRYFFSTATVKPRDQKYVLSLTYDASGYHVQQLDATFFDPEKVNEQEAFRNQNTGLIGIEANWYRTADGSPFMSSAIAKLFLLGAIKYATRDPYGMGVEYEAGRPGWLDSMNGLPGMIGSGMPETYELLLLLKYVKKVVDTYKRPIEIPDELNKMLHSINKALDILLNEFTEPAELPLDVPKPLFEYWDIVAAARENYRNDAQYYFSGNTTTLRASYVSRMVGRWIDQVEIGIKRSFQFATSGYGDDGTSGIPACFFAYEVTDWQLNKGRNAVGLPLVNALAMKVKIFPLFLEAPVRYMKTIEDDHDKMKDMYERVLNSGLRDTKLNMYFLSASLKGQSFDMGRQIAFAPGWLENQSIWMHMSYKYYLELIRGKLYDEFFSEMKGGGILPFMDPEVYGRSLMECSSFIASSAFPDPSIVGEGFLARLSGSTAEFMDIWKLMFIGPKLFTLDDENNLQMQFLPALPSWLFEDPSANSKPNFDEDGNHIVIYKLFGAIPVTYHNPGGKNLFGVPPHNYKVVMDDGKEYTFNAPYITSKTAKRIRRVKGVAEIHAYF